MIRKISSRDTSFDIDDDIQEMEQFVERRQLASDNRYIENHYHIEEPVPQIKEKSVLSTLFSSSAFNSIFAAIVFGLASSALVVYDSIKKFNFNDAQNEISIKELKDQVKDQEKEIADIKNQLAQFESTLMNIYRSNNLKK